MNSLITADALYFLFFFTNATLNLVTESCGIFGANTADRANIANAANRVNGPDAVNKQRI